MVIIQHYIISIAILSLFIFSIKCACAFFFRPSVVSNEQQGRLPIITITFSRFWPMCFAFKLYHDGSRLLSLKSRFNLDIMLNLRFQFILAPCSFALTRSRFRIGGGKMGQCKKRNENVCSLLRSTSFQTLLNVKLTIALSMISIFTSLQLDQKSNYFVHKNIVPTKSEARMCS